MSPLWLFLFLSSCVSFDQRTPEPLSLSDQEKKQLLSGHLLPHQMLHLKGISPTLLLRSFDQLDLTALQTSKIDDLERTRKKAIRQLATQWLDSLKALEQELAKKRPSLAKVRKLLSEGHEWEAKLRYLHIKATLQAKTYLSPDQLAKLKSLQKKEPQKTAKFIY